MSKQAVSYERRRSVKMRNRTIQTIICLAFCLMLFLGTACATAPSTVVPSSSTWEDRLTSYLDIISEEGYIVARTEHTTSDYGSEYDHYYLSKPNLEEGSEYVVEINTNTDERRTLSIAVANNDSRAINQENIEYLMQALVRVCDPSIANNDKEVELRVKGTFQNEQLAEDFIVNGICYQAGMYHDWIVFLAMDPYVGASDKSIPEVPTKPFAFTQEEWIGWFSTAIQPYAVTLKEATAAEASDADLKEMVVPNQTEVYTLEHQLGISVGWILLDTTEQDLCQIRFVKKTEDIASYLSGDIKDAVVRACDPDFQVLPLDEQNEAFSDFCWDLWKQGETKERNGIAYETDIFGDVFTVHVS